MLEKKRVTRKEFWAKVGKQWKYLKPPYRPSERELKIYAHYIREQVAISKTKPKALVLGATPELRDILASYKYLVVLVDINKDVVKEMGTLLEISKGQERVIIADWLQVEIKEQFDIILCDHGLHFIEFREWERFFEKMQSFLKENGLFLISIFTKKEKKRVDVDDVILAYRNNNLTEEDRIYYCYHLFFLMATNHFASILQIRKILEEKGLTEEEIKEILPPAEWEHGESYIASKQVTKNIIGKFFNIRKVEIPCGGHPVYSFHQIYCLERKR